jgi:hypothetical protein
MNSFFKRSVELKLKIEKFLDTISNSLSLFESAMVSYLEDDEDAFESAMKRICKLESEADALESEIKVSLYKFMLLPDTRADVLSLVKSLDNVIDATEAITKDYNIQKPQFPEPFHKDIIQLTSYSIQAADALLLAARSFFTEVHLVSAHINKVKFYEHEADLIEDKLNDMIFNCGVVNDLAVKMQLKRFVSKIAGISDEAEFIGDKLTIFTIKREI